MRTILAVGALAAVLAIMPLSLSHENDFAYAISSEPQVVDDTLDALPVHYVGEHVIVPGVAIPGVTDGANPASCSGRAPAATTCSTGLHFSLYIQTMGFFPNNFPGYTGTIETKDVWLSPVTGQVVPGLGAQIFRCNVVNGAFQSCSLPAQTLPTQLNWPPPGTVFEHTCSSFNLGTTTPGGSGPWSCFIDHR